MIFRWIYNKEFFLYILYNLYLCGHHISSYL